jgi:hypothetical protein
MPIIGIIDGSGDTVGTPIIGTATAGDTRANISFTPPTAIGKGTISYTATSSPGSITGTAAGSPVEVNGLTNGVSYTFTVRAITDYGIQSASSAASNAVTPFAPPVYPPAGTLIAANQCSGFTLYNLRADGSGGTYNEILEYNSPSCGYTPPPVDCSFSCSNPTANGYAFNGVTSVDPATLGPHTCLSAGCSGSSGAGYSKAGCPNQFCWNGNCTGCPAPPPPPLPGCTSCRGSSAGTEVVNSFCSGGCRYYTRRYYWNAPYCLPDPCSPCACQPYNDVNELVCCACFGCY